MSVDLADALLRLSNLFTRDQEMLFGDGKQVILDLTGALNESA